MANRQRLTGRVAECRALDELLAGARAGRSRVLVLVGEPGIGKSALLDHAVDAAEGFTVIRTSGVESDMELAYAGLQQLCAPLLGLLDGLPEPQAGALETAFGLKAGPVPDRFLVGLAVLGLLAAASATAPVLCVVDDAQWLDGVSAQTLSFVARRLLAESVALVFAQREPVTELAGLPQLAVRGLSDVDADALLDSAMLGRIDRRVRDQLVAEAQGNPLALLELPRDLNTAELAGGYYRPDARAIAGQIEERFAARINKLPDDTRQVLALAAAEPVGDPMLLLRAAELLGLEPDSVVPAAAAGLIEVGTRVRFRHPLVRAAAYRTAPAEVRVAAHRALADASDSHLDPDRRAWHRAHAATMPDESVAAELVASADRAHLRGGTAAEAAFLARAAELTLDPALRGTRAIAAAEAKAAAAAPEAADELLAVAELSPLDAVSQARLERLRAALAFARSRGTGSAPLLREAANAFAENAIRMDALDPQLAQEAHLDAMTAAMYVGRHGGSGLVLACATAAARSAVPVPPRPIDLMTAALAVRHTDGCAAAQQHMRAAVDALTPQTWFWQAFPLAYEVVVHDLWDDDAWDRLSAVAVRVATDAGALAVLPSALVSRAGMLMQTGDFASARSLIAEAAEITSATGHRPVRYFELALAAWTGDERLTAELVQAARRDGAARGEGRVQGLTGYTCAVLFNGLGRYQVALQEAQQACEYDDAGLHGFTLVELVEAAVRAGQTSAAHDAAQRFEERAADSPTEWARGLRARNQALLASGSRAEALYNNAIDHLSRTRIAVLQARTHLLYGEWLRRENRRADARAELRRAHQMFSGFGADAFADRARRELLATGEKTTRRPTRTGDALTPQEDQIAGLAASGMTNVEIGAQLFISAHTVEWHLRKVFAKLGIRSRRELRGTPWR